MNIAEAINKVIERVPDARFMALDVESRGFRIDCQGKIFWVSFDKSFCAVPEERLAVNIFDDLPENKESKKIENLLNAVASATLSESEGE